MNQKQQLLSLLFDYDIKSIPRVACLQLAREATSRSEDWCSRYLDERIEPLIRFIEPLCDKDSGQYHHTFSVRSELRGEMSECELAMMQAHSAIDSEKSDSDELYDHVQNWVSVELFDVCTPEDVVGCRLQMATCLRYMNRPSLAAGLWEYWLGLGPDDYCLDASQPDEHLKKKLTQTALQGHTYYVQICVVTSLARALAFADGRMDEHAVSLIESWLGFFPSAYQSRIACELMLEQSPLPKVDSPHDEALLLATLGQSLCCLNERLRSKEGAVNILKAWAEIPETAYSASTSVDMISAMPSSCFGQIGNAPGESLFVGVLGDTLRAVPNRQLHEMQEARDSSSKSMSSAPPPTNSVATWDGDLETTASTEDRPAIFNGTHQALNLMEGWLQIPQNLYENRNYEAVRESLNISPLPHCGSADTQANFVLRFIETLRQSPRRGARHATTFLSAWLQLPNDLVETVENVSPQEVLSQPQISAISNDQIRINLVCSLASALRQVDEYGARYGAQLLLEYVAIDTSVLCDKSTDSTELLESILGSAKLKEVDSRSIHYFIETLSKCVKTLPDYGFQHAITWLCQLLNLDTSSVFAIKRDPVCMSFDNCGVSEDQQGTTLIQLAEALKTSGPDGVDVAAFVLSTWSDLDQDLFSHGTAACVEQFETSRIRKLPNATASVIVSHIADAWLKLFPNRTESATNILLAFLSVSPKQFSAADPSMQVDMVVNNEEFWSLGSRTNQAIFVRFFCESLSLRGKHERAFVLRLLESWCGEPILKILDSEMLRPATLVSKIGIASVGLNCLEQSSKEAYELAGEIVDFILDTSNESIDFEWRKDFMERIRSIWTKVKEVGLARSELLSQAEDKVDEVDQKLLAWAEVFENRLLVDEYQLTKTECGEVSELNVSSLIPGVSALRGEWSEEKLEARKREWSTAARSSLGQISACIHTNSPSKSRYPETRFIRRSREQMERLTTLTKKDFHLVDAVPEGSIWIRSFFDAQGHLHSWAYTNRSDKLQRIGRYCSRFDSYKRLSIANLIVDTQIELIWQRCTNSFLSTSEQVFVPLDIEESLFDVMLTSLSKKTIPAVEIVVEHASICRELEANNTFLQNFPNLLSLSSVLLSKELLTTLSADPELIDQIIDGLKSIQEIMNDSPEDWEKWRKESLNSTSDWQIAICEKELPLQNLLAGIEVDNLRKRDVIFQVEGPLLGIPLSWLPYQGNPFFLAVSSTSLSVSARFRALPQPTDESTDGHFELVTATWELPERRARGATGIAILENDVRRYISNNHAAKWRHWGLGDIPKATHANLARMTEVLKESLRMLLICAHGDEIRLGVSLADEEPWLGRGAKIDNCDFLVIASCAMGKLLHSSGQDVEGFLAGLFTQGAKSVLAAKWRIADMETSQFLYEVITSYVCEYEINPSDKFLRARVLNRVLRDYVETSNDHQIPKFTKHLAMAFDIYGIG